MKRLITFAVSALIVLSVVISTPKNARFCMTCEQQCIQDYAQLVVDCSADGTPVSVCETRNKDFMRTCGVVMCPVCSWYENY